MNGTVTVLYLANQHSENLAMKIPEATHLPREANDNPCPFYFLADEAFPFQHDIMRPFPRRVFNNNWRIFTFRLSRDKQSVECTFGMLTSIFCLFVRIIYTNRSTLCRLSRRRACFIILFADETPNLIFHIKLLSVLCYLHYHITVRSVKTTILTQQTAYELK